MVKRFIQQCLFYCFIIIAFFNPIPLLAQSPQAMGTAEIYQQLKQWQVLGSVLYIAAHPDDENNSLLPYLAKEKKYRTAYLSLTRGDGGQNLIGPEQGIELGLIRTQELLAARRIDGAEQYFSSAYEFGFSKSANETLRYWNKQKVLADMVWVIRKFQPDIIINRFPPDARAGHAHHTASAMLSIEAFKAAANPTQFPEQLKEGVSIWQAKRLLWNTFNFGGANTTSDTQLKIDAGVFNPLIGKNYGELGGEARSMHKSQGEGRPRRKGQIYEYFATIAGDSAKNSLMDGIVTDWNRIPNGGAALALAIQSIIDHYQFDHPEKSVAPLVKLYQQFLSISYTGSWWQQKKKEIEELIIACAGVFVEATTDTEYAVSGEKLTVNFFLNKRAEADLQLNQIFLNTSEEQSYDTILNKVTTANTNWLLSENFTVPLKKPYSQPYWLAKPLADMGTFNVTDYALIGNAESDPAFVAKFVFSINKISFTIIRPVQYKYVDPVRGELHQPLIVINPIAISLDKHVLLTKVSNTGKSNTSITPLLLQFKSNFTASSIPISISLKDGEQYIFSKDTVMDLYAGNIYPYAFDMDKILENKTATNIFAEISYESKGKKYAAVHNLKAIKYDHIPAIHYFYKHNSLVINDPIKTVAKKIAYIIGAGDLVPEALAQLGYTVDYLKEADITPENLSKYHAIIVGIRAYNIHEWLTNKNDVLNQYIFKGGHLIVQYLKTNQVGNKKVKVGPYAFSISNTRITEENAPVNILNPNHAFLNDPNKISDHDFKSWVQERSTYQMEPVVAPYNTIVGMNDTGEKQTAGSLITAQYGKGNFTYISMTLFRQLPAGVTGAYRILANIIALKPHP